MKRFFFSIKHKLPLLISILLVLSIAVSGYFLINQKSKDIKQDIWKNGVHFAELATEPLQDAYELYFKSESYLFFDRELNHIFSLNEDISRIQIAKFSGEVVFDSSLPIGEQGQGEVEERLEKTIQDIKPAIITDKRVIYVKEGDNGENIYVDANEKEVPVVQNDEIVREIVYPSGDNQTRIVYSVSYKFLEERILSAVRTILLVLLVIAIVGLLIAFVFARKLVNPIMSLTKGAKQIATGDLTVRVDVKTNDETRLLADTFNQMAIDLEKSIEIKIEHERVSKELEIARKIQEGILPTKAPKIEGLDIAVSTSPASEVGGDCYDFQKLTDDNQFFYVGDATGHGVGASLLVALANSGFYAATLDSTDPKKIVDDTNLILAEKTGPTTFLTCVACHWNMQEKIMNFVQCGHDQILLLKAETGEIETLASGGLAMGMLPDISSKTEAVKVDYQSGDMMFLYSDGIPEAYSAPETQLGMDYFKEIIKKHGKKENAQEVHDAILEEVRKYMGNYPQEDDITLMVVKFL